MVKSIKYLEKLSRLVRIGFLVVGMMMISFSSFAAASYYSIVNGGAWTDLLSWSSSSGGATCTCSPNFNSTSANDNIFIETNITLTGNLSVSANTTITVRAGDTLWINGDATFSNGSVINIEATGAIIISGNLTNNNNSNTITIDGYLSVGGNFDGGNGSEINGAGGMDVSGTATTAGTGTIFGSTFDCAVGPCNSSASSPLPVELIEFSVVPNGKIAQISWTTASEINNDYFILEKSMDGENWRELLITNGAGNSATITRYFEVDTEPYLGLSYYRLRQVDFNGEEQTFDMVPLKLGVEGEEAMVVFPNPTRRGQIINIAFNDLENLEGKEVLVVLRDLRGVEVYSKVQVLSSKEDLILIDRMDQIASGMYLVIASSEDKLYSKKVVVK